MLKSMLMAAAAMTAASAAYAQPAPRLDGQLQQIPPAPVLEAPKPEIGIVQPTQAPDAAPAGAAFQVNTLQVTGATLFSEADLIATTGFSPGASLTLPELRNKAAAIAAHYNSRGYFLAQAYLPAQDIKDGVVTIAVIEGRYGAIELRNETRLSDGVARRMMGGLRSGEVVAIAPLERSLLLLSDTPGILVKSTLAPGAEAGTSNLTVDIAQGRRVTGSLEADNAGSRYTGEYRFGGSVNFNNPTGLGDQISLRILASTDGLAYGRLGYQAPVGEATLGVSYTHLTYELGREFEALDATGTADIVSVYGSYPLVRARDRNLYAFAAVDAKVLKDEIGLGSQVSDKNSQALTVGLRGNARDDFGGGGWTDYSLSWTTGTLELESPLDKAADALTANTDGTFNKIQFSLSRLQSVRGPFSVYGAVRGQIATDNLDSSEQMELGGAYAVRAYPEGEAYGDEGYVATIEARFMLDQWTKPLPGRFQLFGFVDAGQVRFAHDPWFPGSNDTSRSGYGVGLLWSGPQNLIVKASYARKLGDEVATSAPDEDGRAWFQVVKLF